MLKKVIIGIVIVIGFVGVIVLLTSGKDSTKQTSKNSSQTDTTAPQQQSENTVNITNFAFKPERMSVKKGITVTWVNNDPTQHSVVFDDSSVGKVEDSKLISKGEKLTYTFNSVGSFPYHCMPHPYMTGTITVTQ